MTPPRPGPSRTPPPAALALAALLAAGCAEPRDAPAARARPVHGPDLTIRGTGASFPSQIYSRWALAFFQKEGLRLEYRPGGSQAGVAAIKAGEVDFGATDIPLPAAELARHGLVQFPMVMGGVVPVYNLPGVAPGALRLTADILAAVYLGRLTRWDAPAMRRANPGLRLPPKEIIPISHPAASGTGRLFKGFLGSASPAWRAGVSKGGRAPGVLGKSNAQVAAFVGRFKHTLGYVEYSFAQEGRLSWARLRNGAGRFCVPGLASFQAAAEQGTWSAAELRMDLISPAGEGSWPITGASYVLVRRRPSDRRRAWWTLRFFSWALSKGAPAARRLQEVTLPPRHVKDIQRAWAARISCEDGPVWPGPG